MYAEILKLVLARKALSFLLLLLLTLSASVQGLAVSVIAPLVDVTSNSEPSNDITRLFYHLFKVAGVSIDIVTILIFALGLALSASCFNVMAAIVQRKIQLGFEYTQKSEFYSSLGHLRADQLHAFDFGNIIQVVQQETRMSSMLIEYMVRLISSLIQASVYFVILMTISGFMTVFVMVALFSVWLIVRHLYVRAKRHGRKIGECNDRLQGHVNLMLYGYPVLKAFNVFNVIISRQKKILDEYIARSSKLAVTEAALDGIFQPLALLIILMGYKIYQYTVSELFVFTASILRLYNSVQSMQNVHYKISKNYASLERIADLRSRMRDSSERPEMSDGKPFAFDSHIAFDSVGFSYKDNHYALEDVSLTIKQGQQIALVGASGAGKSTVLALLLGLYRPGKGGILIDGVNLNEIDSAQWHDQIGYVPQEPFLVPGSILDNVGFYRLVEESEVIRALKIANAWEFVEKLPEGIHSAVGEAGRALSGGQKQRIALARALVKCPSLLILDEATSALDNYSERLVKEAIRGLRGSVTVITVAHRLTTVEDADHIYVFKEGRMVECGNFENLIAAKGYFSSLANALG